jgi:hypothetical protein
MMTDQIREAMHAAPFRPFLVDLADGRSFLVRHPDFIAVAPGGGEATIFDDDGSHMVNLILVTSLRVPNPPSASTSPATN